MTPYEKLKKDLSAELLKGRKKFTWRRIALRYWRQPKCRFLTKWRIANCLYSYGDKRRVGIAKYLNRKLISNYHVDIGLGADIGSGLIIHHHVGIVICEQAVIGTSVQIRQNTTIGIKTREGARRVCIGNNVDIGAHSCIIGDDLKIGDNVKIGAMSFVNKDIPSGVVYFTPKKDNTILESSP